MYFAATIVLGVLSVCGVLGEGLECDNNPRQSLPLAEIPDFAYGGAPEPTAPPNVPFAFGELVKRQQQVTLNTICGVLNTNTSWSYSCDSSWLCGLVTTDRKNFGCCQSYLGGGTLASCYAPTACYDSTAAVSISCGVNDHTCNWSTRLCTSSQYPYCGKFYESGLSAWACFATPSASYNLIAYTGPAATTVTGTNSISGSKSSSITATSSSSTSTGLGTGVPFTQQQQSVGGDSTSNQTPAPRPSKGMAPTLVTSGERWYGSIMAFFLLFM